MVHALLWALEQPASKFRLLADNFLAVTRFDAMTWSELVACCGAKQGNSILARKTIEGKRIKKWNQNYCGSWSKLMGWYLHMWTSSALKKKTLIRWLAELEACCGRKRGNSIATKRKIAGKWTFKSKSDLVFELQQVCGEIVFVWGRLKTIEVNQPEFCSRRPCDSVLTSNAAVGECRGWKFQSLALKRCKRKTREP